MKPKIETVSFLVFSTIGSLLLAFFSNIMLPKKSYKSHRSHHKFRLLGIRAKNQVLAQLRKRENL
jgi:hypothetical protein